MTPIGELQKLGDLVIGTSGDRKKNKTSHTDDADSKADYTRFGTRFDVIGACFKADFPGLSGLSLLESQSRPWGWGGIVGIAEIARDREGKTSPLINADDTDLSGISGVESCKCFGVLDGVEGEGCLFRLQTGRNPNRTDRGMAR